MRAVIQRVSRAAVRVDGTIIGEISRGLLVLLGIGKTDTEATSDWMINKLLTLRIFPDEADKMNRSVTDVGGGILIVSQFTLYGELQKGTRPSFSDAMPPAEAQALYNSFVNKLRTSTSLPVAEGKFAAMMDVELVNDGPVTIVLDTKDVARASRPSVASGVGVPPASSPLFIPFDPQENVSIHERRLPHWQQPGRTYFITFRLADSLPQSKLQQWHSDREQWLRQHPEPQSAADQIEYQRSFGDQLEQWLDTGCGDSLLRQSAVADIVEQCLKHFDGQRCILSHYVIMPNHVHVLVTLLEEHTLPALLHSWKSYSAHAINELLKRSGPVWQPEYFDHLVRTEWSLQQFISYIRQNPVSAGLLEGEYRLGLIVHHESGRDARVT